MSKRSESRCEKSARTKRRPNARRRRMLLQQLERRAMWAADVTLGVARPDGGTLMDQFLDKDTISSSLPNATPEISFKFGVNSTSTAPAANTSGSGPLDDYVLAGDLSGIGYDQVVVARGLSGGSLQWLGDTDRDTTQEYLFRFGLNDMTPLIADMNGDGIDDVIAVDTTTTSDLLEWYVHYGDAGTPFPTDDSVLSTDATFSFGVDADSVAAGGGLADIPRVGDINGDGRADVLAVRVNGGNKDWYISNAASGATPWPNNTATVVGVDSTITYGAAANVPVVADWDNDGDDNIGVVNEATSPVTWNLDTNGGGAAELTPQYGLAGDQYFAGEWPDVVWDGGGDGTSWSNAANWSADTLPINTDSIVVDLADADPIINYDAGTNSFLDLVSRENITVSGGSLTLTGNSELANVDVAGGTFIPDGTVSTPQFSLSSGTLRLTANPGITDNPIDVSGGTIDSISPTTKVLGIWMNLTGDLTVAGTNDIVFSGQLNGTGGLIKNDTGLLRLTNNGSYSGQTTINGGSLMITNVGQLGSTAAGTTINDGGTLILGGLSTTVTSAEPITANGSSAILTLDQNSTHTGTINIAQTSLDIAGGSGGTLSGAITGSQLQVKQDVSIANASALTNSVTISNGAAVTLTAVDALPLTTGLSLSGGAVDLNDFSQTVGWITGNATSAIDLGTANLTTGTTSVDTGFGGVISGSGGVTKVGDSNLNLSGVNTYTGVTTISEGVVIVFDSGTLGDASGGTIIQDGATLSIGGGLSSGSSAESITAQGAAPTLTLVEDATYSGVLTIAGSNLTVVGGTGGILSGSVSGPLMTISQDVNLSGAALSATQVVLNTGAKLSGTGSLAGALITQAGQSAVIAPGNSPGTINTGDFTLAAGNSYVAEIGGLGANPGMDYDQVNVSGTVTLAGSLDTVLYRNVTAAEQYVIINNDGADAVTGTFDGLAEGATIAVGPASFTISYVGGDGNDVVLTATNTTTAAIWDGGGDGLNWGDANNWVGDTLPGVGVDVVIDDTGTPEIVVNIPNVTVNSLSSSESMRFNSGPFTLATTATVEGLMTIGSAELVGGTWESLTGITTTSSSSNRFTNATIASGINLGSLGKLGIYGSTAFTSMTLTGDSAEVKFGDGVTITGDITSSGGGAGRSIALEPLATVTVDSGATISNQGTAGLGFALSTGTLINNGTLLADFADIGVSGTATGFQNNGVVSAVEGKVELQFPPNNYSGGTLSGGQWLTSNEDLGRIVWNNGPAPVSTIDSTIELNVQYAPGSSHGIESNLNNDALASITTITSSGSLTVGSVHVRTNVTPITTSGTLRVDGELTVPDVTVATGGDLRGEGTVVGPVTAQSGGTVSPGNSPGVINTGNFDLQSGALLEIEVGGTGGIVNAGVTYDQVNVTGNVTLAGTLDLYTIDNITLGQQYTIINNDGGDLVSGTFDGLAEGAQVVIGATRYLITYVGGDGNDVVLTANTTTGFRFWDGGGDGTNWEDPLNWVGDTVPGTQAVHLSVPGDITVVSTGTVLINSLTSFETISITGGSFADQTNSFYNNGLEVSGGTFSPSTNAFVSGTSSITGGTIAGAGNLDNLGVMTISGNAIVTGTLVNSNAITQDGDATLTGGTIHNELGSTYTIDTGTTLNGDAAALFLNEGTLTRTTASGSGVATFQAPIRNVSGSITAVSGGAFQFAGGGSFQGSLTGNPSGFLTFSAGTYTVDLAETASFDIAGNGVRFNGGTLQVDGTLTNNDVLQFVAGSTITLTGTVNSVGDVVVDGQMNGTGTIDIVGGTLSGTGTAANVVNTGGEVAPGNDGPGVLGMDSYFDVASTTIMEIGGAGGAINAGVNYDQLDVGAGGVTVGGILDVRLTGNVIAGQEYVLIDLIGGSPISGSFANAAHGNTLQVGPALFDVSYTSFPPGSGNDLVLVATNTTTATFWDGGGDGVNWSDALNWAGDIVPGAGADVVIDVPNSTSPILYDIGTVSLNSITSAEPITFDRGSVNVTGNVFVDGQVRISGGTTGITLRGGAWEATGGFLVESSFNRIDGVTLLNNVTIGSSPAKLELYGDSVFPRISLTGTSGRLAVEPGTTINGDITAVGSGAVRFLEIDGPGSVTLAEGKTLLVISDNGLTIQGASGAFINDGTITQNGPGTLQVDAGTFTNNGTVHAADGAVVFANAISNSTAGTLTDGAWQTSGIGRMQLGAGNELATIATTVDLQSTQRLEAAFLSNALSNLGSITSTGSLTIGTGLTTSISPAIQVAGTLHVDGTLNGSSINVDNGGLLSGSGSVPSVVTQSGATVSPGNSPGIIDVNGNFSLNAGAKLEIELGDGVPGTEYDQVNVTGAVTLGGDLDLSAYSTITSGSTFTIINNDGVDAVIGTFAGLAEGATVSSAAGDFTVSYVGGDGNDVVLTASQNSYVVINTNDAGVGSLRQAITDANGLQVSTPYILFNIPGTGPHTVQPITALPTLSQTVIIDGTSDPDFAGIPIIEIDGVNAGVDQYGLVLSGGEIEVRGLILNNFSGPAMLINSAGNTIAGNWVGLDSDGLTAQPNKTGSLNQGTIHVTSSGNTIGGPNTADTNVISGNDYRGMYFFAGGAGSNTVEGNIIGLDPSGMIAVPNNAAGIVVDTGPGNQFGVPGGRPNIISANNGDGIFLFRGGNTSIVNNYIGTDITGSIAFPNQRDGIQANDGAIATNGIVIGQPGAGNLIVSADNVDSHGIYFRDNQRNVQIQSNILGLDIAGTQDLGVGRVGIEINASSTGTVIGGSDPTERNLIAGHSEFGIRTFANDTTIQNNYIGTDATGLIAIPNDGGGVEVDGATGVVIGSVGAGNVITPAHSGVGNGIDLINSSVASIKGNYIGVGSDGETSIGNSTNTGIRIRTSAGTGTQIGGVDPGEGNIVGNTNLGVFVGAAATVEGNLVGVTSSLAAAPIGGQFGVQLASPTPATMTDNTIAYVAGDGVSTLGGIAHVIEQNSIYSNAGLGIDIDDDGLDSPAQIAIDSIDFATSDVNISLANLPASTGLTVYLYEGDAPGDAQSPLGFTALSTDGSGDATINFPGVLYTPGKFLTAYASDAAFGTTELASSVKSSIVVSNSADSGPGSLRQAILDANAQPNADIIDFFNTSPGWHTIVLGSALPSITQPVSLNGYADPEASPNTQVIGNDAEIVWVIDGVGNDVFTVSSDDVNIRGLSIVGADDAVLINSGAQNVSVAGNFLGLLPDGMTDDPNANASVRITAGANNNVIGGDDVSDRNAIAGASTAGIWLEGVSDNFVKNNYVGTVPDGSTAATASPTYGVYLTGVAQRNEIAGRLQVNGNVLSGNGEYGIRGIGDGVDHTVIKGNILGLNAQGDTALLRQLFGVQFFIGSDFSVIGGPADGERNIISGNTSGGLYLHANGSLIDGTVIQGNYVGTDVTGMVGIGNGTGAGVSVAHGSGGTLVGGTNPGEGNLMSGHAHSGLSFWESPYVHAPNIALGNTIGLNATGTAAIANLISGIHVGSSKYIRIGSTDPGGRNTISGNDVGIRLAGRSSFVIDSDDIEVVNNAIGLGLDGVTQIPNNIGIELAETAWRHTIGTNLDGTDDELEGNIIAGNTTAGIRADGTNVRENTIYGNTIGLDVLGNSSPNGVGIQIGAANNIPIGSPEFHGGNVISGNTGAGIELGTGSADIVVRSNLIGTDALGTSSVPNGNGIVITDGTRHVIGTNDDSFGPATPGEGNVISGNAGAGVLVSGATVSEIAIAGNTIGLDPSGTQVVGNQARGVALVAGASLVRVGTDGFDAGGTDNPEVDAPSERNIISGNVVGIEVDAAGSGNIIAGNYIGTDVTGTLDLGNSQGVTLTAGTGATIIGTNMDGSSDHLEGNVISGNDAAGVILRGSGSLVRGNRIGTDTAGVNALANGVGVIVDGTSQTVGGVLPHEGNAIAFNSAAGVAATDALASGTIRGNSIFDNGGSGIELGVEGPLPNDALDADSGPNTLQNFPVINSASSAATTTVAGTFVSAPSTTFTLDFYGNLALDPTTYGEGQRYLGSGNVTTDGSGSATFNIPGLDAAFPGEFVTATATNPTGNTSEFSIGVAASTSGTPTIDPNALLITFVDTDIEEQTFGLPTLDIDEGEVLDLTGDFANADATVQVSVNWGDGTSENADIVGTESFAAAHVYDDDNPSASPSDLYGVFVTATDSNGSGSALVNVTVHNVDPVIDAANTALNATTISEGDTVTLSGVFNDPGTGDHHTLRLDWGDGSPLETIAIVQGDRNFSASHTYVGDGEFAVRYSVFDDDRDVTLPSPGDVGFTYDAHASVSVANLPPTATINVGSTFEEGDLIPISANVNDAGGDPITYEWVINRNGTQVFSDETPSLQYTPIESGSYSVELLLSDGQSEALFQSSFEVTNPAVQFSSADVLITDDLGAAITGVVEGATIQLSGAFADKSPNDAHTISIDFGDGSPTHHFSVEVGERSFDAIGHTYLDDPSGLTDEYLIRVSVDDGDDVTETLLPFVVQNAVPTVAIQNEASSSTSLNFSATVADEGVLDTHSYEWIVNGDASNVVTTPTLTNVAPNAAGLVNVELRVTDKDSGVASVTSLGVVPTGINAQNVVSVVNQASGMTEITVDSVVTMLTGNASNVFVLTGDDNDTVTVTSQVGAPPINARIDAGPGDDVVTGGAGNDVITGGPGADQLNGGAGNDELISDEGDDTLNGDIGDDVYTIISFSDKLIVDGQGDDTLNFGDVSVAGGAGDEGITLDLGHVGQQTVYTNGATVGRVTLQGSFENVVGSSFKDTLKGNADSNRLFGGPGDDTIQGSGSDDTLLGGDGGDVIMGAAAGNTSVDGGDGDDEIYGGGDGDTLFGGPGDDTITGVGDETLIGGDGSDQIIAGGDDSIDGGNGDDRLIGGNSDGDTLFGGPGDDTITGGGNDTLIGGVGDDEITGGSGNESIDGGIGDDVIVGGGSPSGGVGDTIFGGPGDDTITGGGNDILVGGDGGDMIIAGAGQESIDGGSGDDEIIGSGGQDTLFGGPGDDTITGGDDDTILGGVGNDVIIGSGTGDESIDGGAGDDMIVGGGSGTGVGDTIFGGPGDDTIESGGDDTLVGGTGSDQIIGSSDGSDSIHGGIGDDVLIGGGNSTGLGDTVFGGPGDDTIMGGGTDTLIGGAGDDEITGSADGDESIEGGDGDDEIYSGGGGDTVFGGPGDDSITGSGEDTISGGDGNDLILGGSSGALSDSIHGGAGDDQIIAGDGALDTIFGGPGDDTISSQGGQDTLDGGSGDDLLTGSSDGSEVISGGDGDDTIDTTGGGDTVFGGAGNDRIIGRSAGATGDRIDGEGGDDFIESGLGSQNEIFGGPGDDTISGAGTQDTLIGGTGNDVIAGSDLGSATIGGGDGDDVLSSGSGNDDTVDGGDGDDTLYATGGADVVLGNTGDDVLFGSAGGAELLRGGDGDDTLNSGGGVADTIAGGAGDDWLVAKGVNLRAEGGVEAAGSPPAIDRLVFQDDADQTVATGGNPNEASLMSGGALVANLIDIDAVSLFGGTSANLIDASAFNGQAALYGNAGNDTLLGGSGDDQIDGGEGDDSMRGAGGDDTYFFVGDTNLGVDQIDEADPTSVDTLDFFGFRAPVEIDLTTSATQVLSPGRLSVVLTNPEQIENVVGTVFNDRLYGNDKDNRLVGGGGSDFVYGDAGNDYLTAARTRFVYLDFDSHTVAGDHVYLQAERDAIEARMRQDFAAFDVQISQTVPSEEVFVTVLFNAPPIIDGHAVSGGVSERIGFRDVSRGGTVQVDVNDFIGVGENQLPEEEDSYVALSSTIASHELAHMYGVRHQDAFGSPEGGVFDGLDRGQAFLPSFGGPRLADETREHLASSPASVGTTLADALGNPYFGEREALKLAFGESGTATLEVPTAQKSTVVTIGGVNRVAQDLGALVPIFVPNTIENPLASGYDVSGAPIPASVHNVVGEIELVGGISENDLYAFQANANDSITVEIYSSSLRNRIDNTIDSLVRVFDSTGSKLAYHGNPLGAFNDDGFEPTDSVLINLPIPATGTYFVEVDTFNFGVAEFPDYVSGFDAIDFCDGRVGDVRCDDTDTGGYELFLYRFDATSTATPTGDVIIGGPGQDTLITSSGFDSFLVDATDTFDGPAAPENVTVNQPPTLTSIPAQTVNLAGLLQFGALGSDPDTFDEIKYSIRPNSGGAPFPTSATMDPDTGQFDWTATANGTFEVLVEVTDLHDQVASQVVTINVISANSAPTDLSLSATTINENVNAGTVVGTVSVTDPDAGDSHTLTLLDDAGGNFVLAGDQIQVSSTADLDFETVTSYSIRLQAKDSGGLTFDKLIEIGVNDLPEVVATDIGGGLTQRSVVRDLEVKFDGEVTIASDAFQLVNRNQPAGSNVVTTSFTTSVVGGNTIAKLTFSGSLTRNPTAQSAPLVDGNYELKIDGNKVLQGGIAIDGDGDGVAGGEYNYGAQAVDNFYTQFGDKDGSRKVDIFDFLALRPTFAQRSGDPNFDFAFDYDDDGDVDIRDFLFFRRGYAATLDFQ